MQQDLFKQQKIIEDCETNIENLMKERQSLDESVKCKKISWKEEINQLNLEKKKGIGSWENMRFVNILIF